jgi:subtilisin family serine protease
VRGAVDDYTPGEFYVGADRRYYRATGTSFAAPIVSGIASLVLSSRPELTGEQLETVIVQSAEDIQTPGRDNFSGAGLVDAKAALAFDPSVRLEAVITGIEVAQGRDGPLARVLGTIAADRLASAKIEIGAGRAPASFRTVASGLPAGSGTLAEIPAEEFRGAPLWTIRLVVTHSNGTQREARFQLDVGG